MIANTLPAQIDMLLIDGGIIGCSMAYHLTRFLTDVGPLRRKHLTSGTRLAWLGSVAPQAT